MRVGASRGSVYGDRLMDRRERERRAEVIQTLGGGFFECVCPPIPFENGLVADFWDVVCSTVGDEVTPSRLAALTPADLRRLRAALGERFDTDAPSVRQVKSAIADTLARWPVGSLGEQAQPDVAPDSGSTAASQRSRSSRRRK